MDPALPQPSDPSPTPADAIRGSWVSSAPQLAQPYLRLSRFDRPIGFWLLGLPCLAGLALARHDAGFTANDGWLAILYLIGAVAMRGAGCTYNDILDRDYDAKVERTALRPLPAGAITMGQAWLWLAAQCLVGLLVLLMLPTLARYVALASLPLVALYPVMKRITWWPQAWLGLTLNWGVLVAAAGARGNLQLQDGALYAGLALWTIGYDTIYAAQDREDDALIGVRSTARLFGPHIKSAVWIFYCLTTLAVSLAAWLEGGWTTAVLIAPFGLHLGFQAVRFDPDNNALTLRLFRSNRDAVILLVVGLAIAASVS